MAQTQSQALSSEKFLLVAANLLHRALLQTTRTQAKRIYRELERGNRIALDTVELEDKSTARFELALDLSEFRGKLNFGAFRAGVELLIANIATALKEEKRVPLFSADSPGGATIFGVTAVTVEDERANLMVLGSESAPGGRATTLRLMYLDPEQFRQQQGE